MFKKPDDNYKLLSPRISTKPNIRNMMKTTPKHIITKLLKTNDKKKNLLKASKNIIRSKK